MLKFSRMLPSSSRNQLLEILSSKKLEVRDFSTATNNYSAKGYDSDRIFAPYSVYKGKAAFSLSPCLPTFTKLDSGALVVDRRGSIMMSFMPAIGERKYDSDKKQLCLCLRPHNAGQVRKSLSIKPHSNGYFVSLTVVNILLNTKDNFSVPVTTAEFAVMKTACSVCLFST
ncbi:hypothetical protein TSUD_346800 [Trifolium subterraneum]|nr:hypothetical protein TSUD_346800 [Trifolium subterraneum]